MAIYDIYKRNSTNTGVTNSSTARKAGTKVSISPVSTAKKTPATKPKNPPGGSGSGSGSASSITTNAKKAAAQTTPTPAAAPAYDYQPAPMPSFQSSQGDYSKFMDAYMKAYQPTVDRETQRADAQMASRGLTFSTAGAGYSDAARQAIIAEAYKQGISVAEAARQSDNAVAAQVYNAQLSAYSAAQDAAAKVYGMNLGYERDMALGFEDKGFTFNPTNNNWVQSYLSAPSRTSAVTLADALTRNAKIGDATEDQITASAPRSTVTSAATGTRSVADVRGARLLREYQLEKEKNAIEQQLARQSLALEREKLAMQREQQDWERGQTEAGAFDSSPYQTALAAYLDTGDTKVAEATFTSMTGKNLIEEARNGDTYAIGILKQIRPRAWGTGLEVNLLAQADQRAAAALAAKQAAFQKSLSRYTDKGYKQVSPSSPYLTRDLSKWRNL